MSAARWRSRGALLVMVLLGSGSIGPALSGASGIPTAPGGGIGPTGPSSSGVVPLIPGASPFVVTGSPEDPEPLPVTIGHAFVYPDLYNTVGGRGNATLAEAGAGSALTATIDFANVSGRTPGVVGYPEVEYGPKPWCSRAPCPSPPGAPALSLPGLVRSLPDIAAVATFRIVAGTGPSAGSFDLAYDLWMTRSPNASAASAGDLELMVWLDHRGSSILPGTPTSTLAIPTLSAGRWSPLPWRLYLQDPVPADANGHWTVAYLVLDPPVSTGTIGVDLTEMVRSADAVLADRYPSAWGGPGGPGAGDPAALYLDDVELGSEFRPVGDVGPAQLDWSLSGYCFGVGPASGSTPAAALTANCSVVPTLPSRPSLGLWVPAATGGMAAAGAVGRWLGSRRRPRPPTPIRDRPSPSGEPTD